MAELYTGGTIWTGGPSPRRVEAVLVRDGTVVALGTLPEVGAATVGGERIERFHLEGKALLPGFVDAHTHFLTGGRKLGGIHLREVSSRGELVRSLADFASTLPAGGWITGGDWDHQRWGGVLPTRDWIDEATPDHPVWVHRLDIHMTLANSRALEIAGIDASTPDPDGGEIVRDADGRPTGILKDTAMDLVGRHLPPPSGDDEERWLAAAARYALSRGITQIHDVDGWASLHTYRRVHDRGTLPLRVYAAVPMRTHRELADFIATHGRGDDRLHWGALKAFVDGSLGSATAWMHEPFEGESGNTGLVVTDLDELRSDILAADRAGLHPVVHAIGDRANDWLLDVFEETIRTGEERDRRLRVEHAQHLSPSALARFGALGVVPSVQPAHLVDDGRWAETLVGADRGARTYAFASLRRHGARLAFGSDWTVADLDPLATVQAAVTRACAGDAHPDGWTPSERIDLETALVAHGHGAAFSGFAEGRTGSIDVGMAADFVVLDRDPFTVDETDLSALSVEYTFVEGFLAFTHGADV